MDIQDQIEGKIVEVGGKKYHIQYWSVDKATELLAWIGKNFGEGILVFFMEQEKLAVNSDSEATGSYGEVFSKTLKKVSANLDPKEYSKYMRYMLSDLKCGPNKIDIDRDFRGKINQLHSLLFEVLTYQYSDFL